MSRWQSVLETRTQVLKAEARWREPDANPRRAPAQERSAAVPVDVTSNDYLGLAERSGGAPIGGDGSGRGSGIGSAASGAAGAALGAGSARLVRGTHPEHRALEREVAAWLELEDSLVFSSGYAANVGLISALAGPGDVIVSDALNHASIIDGCRLSRATVRVVAHRDVGAIGRLVEEAAAQDRVCWVVTESYFSMDGNGPDLARLCALCREHEAALIVDEAHALGVFGAEGRGLCATAGVVPDVLVGGLGKAFGGQGGFVASSAAVRGWLWNRARSFMFSTGVSPQLSAAMRLQLERVRGADEERRHLAALGRTLRERLLGAGLRLPDGQHGPLVPVIVGDEQPTLDAAEALRAAGFHVQPIRPPTVPVGESRLRISLHAGLSTADVTGLGEAVVEVLARLRATAAGGRGGGGGERAASSDASEAPRVRGTDGEGASGLRERARGEATELRGRYRAEEGRAGARLAASAGAAPLPRGVVPSSAVTSPDDARAALGTRGGARSGEGASAVPPVALEGGAGERAAPAGEGDVGRAQAWDGAPEPSAPASTGPDRAGPVAEVARERAAGGEEPGGAAWAAPNEAVGGVPAQTVAVGPPGAWLHGASCVSDRGRSSAEAARAEPRGRLEGMPPHDAANGAGEAGAARSEALEAPGGGRGRPQAPEAGRSRPEALEVGRGAPEVLEAAQGREQGRSGALHGDARRPPGVPEGAREASGVREQGSSGAPRAQERAQEADSRRPRTASEQAGHAGARVATGMSVRGGRGEGAGNGQLAESRAEAGLGGAPSAAGEPLFGDEALKGWAALEGNSDGVEGVGRRHAREPEHGLTARPVLDGRASPEEGGPAGAKSAETPSGAGVRSPEATQKALDATHSVLRGGDGAEEWVPEHPPVAASGAAGSVARGAAEAQTAAKAPPSVGVASPREALDAARAKAPAAGRVAGMPRRWVVLGAGTGVGKTFVTAGLARALGSSGAVVAAVKPIETGLTAGGARPPPGSDAGELEQVSFHVKRTPPHPLFRFTAPLTPALAARREGRRIELGEVVPWLAQWASLDGNPPDEVVVETAGGVFSPISPVETNLELAMLLEPAIWVLVAADRLGVLHELGATLRAMAASARLPDYLVLSAPAVADESTGTNAEELAALGFELPIITLGRDQQAPLEALVRSRAREV